MQGQSIENTRKLEASQFLEEFPVLSLITQAVVDLNIYDRKTPVDRQTARTLTFGDVLSALSRYDGRTAYLFQGEDGELRLPLNAEERQAAVRMQGEFVFGLKGRSARKGKPVKEELLWVTLPVTNESLERSGFVLIRPEKGGNQKAVKCSAYVVVNRDTKMYTSGPKRLSVVCAVALVSSLGWLLAAREARALRRARDT
ncbi:hypothetical protein M885DRAFT_620885 [Pelagophyceae sp. CCMP2097]|nr:hypothetical protein M885DRAFT_620885 [Pelagophyceae sp. CCMP2097]